MHKFLNQNLIWYISIIIPLTYIVGILITEISVLVVSLFFFYKNRNFSYYKEKKFIFFLLISIYIALNSVIQINDKDLLRSSIFHFRYVLFSFSIVFILNYFEEKINYKKNYILLLIFASICFVFFDVFFQFLTGKNIFGFEIIKNRISSIFGSELILGSYLIKIIPIILWLLFYFDFNFKKNKILMIIFFSLFFISIILSGERTSLALALFFIFIIIYFISKLRSIFIISLIVSFLFLSFVSFFNIGKVNSFNRLFTKTFNQITNQIFTNNQNQEFINNTQKSNNEIKKNIKIFTDDHTGHYILAYKLFSEKPLFGHGAKGFKSFCRTVNYKSDVGICSIHPHNYLMQILAELGIIGLILYLYCLFFISIKLVFCVKKEADFKEKACLIIVSAGLLLNLFPFLPSGNFFNNWISIINYYFLGFYLYSYKKVYG